MTTATLASERFVQGVTRRVVLTARYEADLSRRVLSLLIELERDLRGQIASVDPTGVTTPSGRARRLEALLTETRTEIRRVYRRIAVLSETELSELVRLEARATRDLLRDSGAQVGYTLQPSLPSRGFLENLAVDQLVIGEPLRDWWERQSATLQASVARELRLGLAAGETVDQLARRLNPDAFGRLQRASRLNPDANEARGVMISARRNARTLAITAANNAGNRGRLAVYEANQDTIRALQHLSRLDARTTQICIARAGLLWDARAKEPINHGTPFQVPPLHPRCRSVLIPVLVDGEPATDQSGQEYFESLSRAEQDEIFGKGKAQLLRSGQIDATDLLDQSGRPLTLAQLREM